MRPAEKKLVRNPVALTNIGRCPTCGARCQLPCAVCHHPKRRQRLLTKRVRRI